MDSVSTKDRTLQSSAVPGGVAHELVTALETGGDTPEAIGRYRLLGLIGGGAMGVVFLCEDPELGRRVALKLVHPTGHTGGGTDERVRHEAQAMASVSHPNVVHVYEVGTYRDQMFLAMEYVEGVPLDVWLDTPRSVPEVCRVFLDAGRGLAAAHDAGVLHRDFKPANVILGADDRVRVLDFGIARVDDTAPPPEPDEASLHGLEITVTGQVLGTPRYMAPEQFDGVELDARADTFSFCVALYYALYGTYPFAGDDVYALLWSMQEGALQQPPRADRVPRALARVVEQGLAYEPDDRPAGLAPILEVLEQSGRPRSRAGLYAAVAAGTAAVLALVLGLVVGPMLRQDPLEHGVPSETLPADAPTVLWVDDNPRYNGEEIGRLHDLGIRVVTAQTAEAAARHAPYDQYVAIITDMERQNEAGYAEEAGMALIAEVRDTDAETPIFLFTASRVAPLLAGEVEAAGGNGVTGSSDALIEMVQGTIPAPGP